ncbi:MAG TPA: hypothetical protein VEO95_08585, partial [Chthoniobacteraceae bacterium]|nr:hypothetical protein [Chthoniobacteraceae bacterium]
SRRGGIRMDMSTLESSTDTDLLETYCSEGCEAALAVIAERYRPLVFGVAFGYTRDLQAARAATDRVFVMLSREACAIRGRVQLGDWLRHAAASECNADVGC